jgi:hypothetical protein
MISDVDDKVLLCSNPLIFSVKMCKSVGGCDTVLYSEYRQLS